MKVNALIIGNPRVLGATTLVSAIVRDPVSEIFVDLHEIRGDRVANTLHHGGPNRVLHHYPAEHYSVLQSIYPDLDFPVGSIGENMSTTGLTEATVCVGDVFRIGEVRGLVTEPRKPCATINARYGRAGVARLVQERALVGWFYRILTPGVVRLGDTVELEHRPYPNLTLEKCVKALLVVPDRAVLEEMISNPVLSDNWKKPAKAVLHTGVLADDRARLGE